jgi:RNA polymerase-binding transcription factor DksA
MPTKKTPAKAVKKAAPAKKPMVKQASAAKKVAPAKKSAVPVKKSAPVKKPVVAAKSAVVKKSAPAKSVPAKQLNKPAGKKPEAAKASSMAKATPSKTKTPIKAPAAKPAAQPVISKSTPAAKPAPAAPAKTAAPAKPAPQATASKGMASKSAPAVKPAPAPVEPVQQKPSTPSAPIVKPAPKAMLTPVPVPKKQPPAAKPVKLVMPDIKTKTSRKYDPDFTKSVLDTPMQQESGPSQRYSDADLVEFRELINKKLDAAKKELAYLQGLITRKDEMGGDESESRYMTMEDGSVSMEREQLAQMASRQITFIDHLEKAIMRIENKTYGICRVTGKLIDKARLRAVPHATLSIEAKQMMNK